MTPLQVTWFILVAALFSVYAVLDGFDLGAGVWHLFAHGERERPVLLRAIGPFWDGNEVWLLTGGGALFAAFPHVYATVFSGMYLALILVVCALILRAVAVEFRSKEPSLRWRNWWDRAFAVGSILPALLFGIALGNILRGLPLDASHNFTGTFFGLLNPYGLLIGLVSLSLLAFHGALYIAVKTESALTQRALKWARHTWVVFGVVFAGAVLWSALGHPHLLAKYLNAPVWWLLPLGVFAAILGAGRFTWAGNARWAFGFSALSITGVMGLVAVSLFPHLVPALGHPPSSLTVANAASSQLTLLTMLIIALLGLPLVVGYTIWAYHVLGGKAAVDEAGY